MKQKRLSFHFQPDVTDGIKHRSELIQTKNQGDKIREKFYEINTLFREGLT